MRWQTLLLFVLVGLANMASAQWDRYQATWDKQAGTMIVNMDIRAHAPMVQLPYLLEISSRDLGERCASSEEADLLMQLEQDLVEIDSALRQMHYMEDVGRFIHGCKAKAYIYMADTTGVTETLASYQWYYDYKVVDDPKWKVYTDFIYPDDYLLQTMTNDDVILELRKMDMDLTDKKTLLHSATFAAEGKRSSFISFVEDQNFEVVDQREDQGQFIVAFARADYLDISKLSNITLRLYQKARHLKGQYDGWQIDL